MPRTRTAHSIGVHPRAGTAKRRMSPRVDDMGSTGRRRAWQTPERRRKPLLDRPSQQRGLKATKNLNLDHVTVNTGMISVQQRVQLRLNHHRCMHRLARVAALLAPLSSPLLGATLFNLVKN
jgi:hypothetical protein